MSEPLDDAHLHDPAVIAWKNLHCLIDNGAPDTDIDQAMRQYLQACEEQMNQKERMAKTA